MLGSRADMKLNDKSGSEYESEQDSDEKEDFDHNQSSYQDESSKRIAMSSDDSTDKIPVKDEPFFPFGG